MDWTALALPFLTTLCITFIPGLAIALILGLQGLRALAVAPLVSISLIAVAAMLAPVVGLSWGIWPVLLLGAAAAGVALLVRLLAPGARFAGSGWWGRENAAGYAALGVAAVLWGRHLVRMLGTPDAFSQTFDNIFHLNAIRSILDTGDASSLALGRLGDVDAAISFYPGAWHDIVSLTMTLGVHSMPLAINALILVVTAVIWPLSCIFLVTSLFRCHPATILAVGVMSASYANFPIMLLDFGVLYPNVLGLAQLPVLLGLAAQLLNMTERPGEPAVIAAFLGLLAVPGIALSHPNVLFTFAAFVVPMMLARALRQVAAARRAEIPVRRAAAQCAGLLAATAAMGAMWLTVRADEWTWPPVHSSATAVGEFILANGMARPPAWALALLLVAGCIAVVRTGRLLWMLWTALAAVFLWVVASVWVISGIRQFITGPWYNDPHRLAATLPLAALPLAAFGVQWIVEELTGSQLWQSRRAPALSVALIAGVPVALALATQPTEAMTKAVEQASRSYAIGSDSALITPDELKLLERLPELTASDAVIVTNPWNGSSLAYAFGDRNATLLAPFVNPSPAVEVLNEHLAQGADAPDVCAALEASGADYVLDFGDQEVHGGHHVYPGLEDLGGSPAVRLVAQVGGARLYEIVACE